MTNEEIDILVATKIMGWKLHETSSLGTNFIDQEDDVVHEFFPSELIEDAWMVVNRLNKMGYDVEIHASSIGQPFVCVIDAKAHKKSTFAETVPMAICLAALKVVGVEVEE